MKYSLRSLMIVVTLVCVVLGGVMGRIEYLRRMAAYHKREESRTIDGMVSLWSIVRHRALAEAYSQAVHRPWTIVDESKVEP